MPQNIPNWVVQRQFKKACAKIAQAISLYIVVKITLGKKAALRARFKTWHG